MSEETKTRTITLTDRQPVKINEEEWPEIAVGSARWHEGDHEFQANRRKKCSIRVRQHGDGRAIVYGTYEYESQWQGERCFTERAGVLLEAGADLAAAINEVRDTLAELLDDEEFVGRVAREAIADLPAVEI